MINFVHFISLLWQTTQLDLREFIVKINKQGPHETVKVFRRP